MRQKQNKEQCILHTCFIRVNDLIKPVFWRYYSWILITNTSSRKVIIWWLQYLKYTIGNKSVTKTHKMVLKTYKNGNIQDSSNRARFFVCLACVAQFQNLFSEFTTWRYSHHLNSHKTSIVPNLTENKKNYSGTQQCRAKQWQTIKRRIRTVQSTVTFNKFSVI